VWKAFPFENNFAHFGHTETGAKAKHWMTGRVSGQEVPCGLILVWLIEGNGYET